MLVESYQHAAQVDDLFAIELQCHDRSTSGRGDADDLQVIITPGEVRKPMMPARVKQRHDAARERIAGLDLDVLMVVATLTSEGEILRDGSAATMAGNNVLDGERVRRVTRGGSGSIHSNPGRAPLPA